jgi:hypothetical protein
VADLKQPPIYTEGTFIANLQPLVHAITQGRHRSFDKHDLFRIKAKNSSKNWYLDTFGAEYGIFSGCTDGQTYLESFANRVNVAAPGRTWKKLYNMLSQLPREGTVTNRIQFDATMEIVHAMKDFKKETAIEIPDRLRPSDDAYPARRERVLEVISSSLERFVVSAVYDSDFSAIESRNLAEGVEQTCMIVSAM